MSTGPSTRLVLRVSSGVARFLLGFIGLSYAPSMGRSRLRPGFPQDNPGILDNKQISAPSSLSDTHGGIYEQEKHCSSVCTRVAGGLHRPAYFGSSANVLD